MNTEHIASNSPSNNHNVETPKRDRDFATGLAQAAFGHSYAPPHQADLRDRTPGEIAIIRAAGWRGAVR